MLTCFKRTPVDYSPAEADRLHIQKDQSADVLCLKIQDKSKWNDHIDQPKHQKAFNYIKTIVLLSYQVIFLEIKRRMAILEIRIKQDLKVNKLRTRFSFFPAILDILQS